MKKKLFYIFLGFIMLAGFYIRTRLFLASPSLWYDECSLVWNIQTTNYLDFFKPLKLVEQVSPPLFLIITKFFYSFASAYTSNLSVQDMALRFFPFICGCLSVPMFTYLVHKTYNNKYLTLSGCAIMAFNIWTINYGNEVKPYGTELFIGLIFLILFSDLKISAKRLLGYSVFCIISMWISSSAIFFIAACSLIVLFKVKEKKKLLIFFSPLVLNIILYYFSYYRPNLMLYGDYMRTFWEENFFSFSTFLDRFANYTINVFPDIPFDKILHPAIFLTGFYLFLCLNIFFGLKYLKKHHETENIFTICCLVPFFVICASFLDSYPYINRLILFMIPLYIILFYQFLLFIKTNKYITSILVIIIAFFAFLNTRVALVNPTYLTIHKSNIRDFYLLSKTVNPEEKNLIVDESNYMCYSKGQGNIVISPENITDINNLPKGDYYLIISNTYKEKYYDIPAYIQKNCNVLQYIPANNNPHNFFAKIKVD